MVRAKQNSTFKGHTQRGKKIIRESTDSAHKRHSNYFHAFLLLCFKKFPAFRVTVRQILHSTLKSGLVRFCRIFMMNKKSTPQLRHRVASTRNHSTSASFNMGATAKEQL